MRMMDMSYEQLQKAYNHTNAMLHNTERDKPGKYLVKQNIAKLIRNANAELFKRYLMYECDIEVLKTPMAIATLIKDFKKQNGLNDSDPVSMLFDHLPHEFETVTFDELMDACFDQLGVINRKMITEQFIISRGIWLADDEKTELTEYNDDGTRKPWTVVMKERLFLPESITLRIDPKGFTYGEFRALIHLTPLPKISDLSTNTLRLMRDKVFPLLDLDTDWHIKKWEGIKSRIEEVANYKKLELKTKNY